MRYTDKEKSIIIKYYPKGGCKEVQKYINRSIDSIRHTAMSLGVKTVCRQNLCDVNDFLKIDSEKIAYLLGFIWGDGYVSCQPRSYTIVVCIKKDDAQNLRKIFDNRWTIKDKSPQKATWAKQTFHSINHKELAIFLKENDFTIKSITSPEKILKKIPFNLQHHFFRGWFDADGHISSNLTICGTYKQNWKVLEKLSKQLNFKKNIYKWKSDKARFSRFEVCGRDSQKKFLSYIYKDANFKLDRKFLKYQNLIAKIS